MSALLGVGSQDGIQSNFSESFVDFFTQTDPSLDSEYAERFGKKSYFKCLSGVVSARTCLNFPSHRQTAMVDFSR